MPTYSYACSACGHAFDQYQAFTDDSLTECPSCGEATLRKVFNSIGVTFNGSGFYRTESRTGSAKKDAAPAAPSKPAPAAPAASTTSTSST